MCRTRKAKYTILEKVQACEDYISGKHSAQEIAECLNMTKTGRGKISEWVKKYRKYGGSVFEGKATNASYSKEFKNQVAEEYLKQIMSYRDLSVKYNIPSPSIIIKWVTIYTEGKRNRDYKPKSEVSMAKVRKTTAEERKEIVEYCLSHDKDYKGSADIYKVNYAQVYTWVKKYLHDGEEALEDKRGKRKPEINLSESEKQERRIAKLEREKMELQRELELLKKLEELERRR